MTPKDPTIRPYAIGTLVGIVAVLAAFVAWRSVSMVRQSIPAPAWTERTLEEIVEPAKSFNGVNADRWPYRAKAERTVNESQGKTADQENIVGLAVPDPSDDNVWYFATFDSNERFVGIYRYTVAPPAWDRLYKTAFEPEDDMWQYLVVGYDSDRLVLRRTDAGLQFDTCTSPLLIAKEMTGSLESVGPLLTMNLESPYGGFDAYELSAADRERAERNLPPCSP